MGFGLVGLKAFGDRDYGLCSANAACSLQVCPQGFIGRINTYIHIYTHTHTRTHIQIQLQIQMYMHTHTHTHTQKHIYIYIYKPRIRVCGILRWFPYFGNLKKIALPNQQTRTMHGLGFRGLGV